ncbi:hypothetical protein Nepgr_024301 [Nepenthes gracilis]|uniref:Uncharacterized protein n=1 Tax=Nepenthes gracilis TaxID=150966 RepID=A0AAD3T2K9_NEPGR|nr:hypothetical protein Nepgr_024301 [Nepenthes gracilis]
MRFKERGHETRCFSSSRSDKKGHCSVVMVLRSTYSSPAKALGNARMVVGEKHEATLVTFCNEYHEATSENMRLRQYRQEKNDEAGGLTSVIDEQMIDDNRRAWNDRRANSTLNRKISDR